jgi:bla regulator protein blaR1
MIPDHLWQSTLFAGLIALLALVLRKNQARTRYWLWLIASAKFLFPFFLLVALGGHIEWASAPKAQKLAVVAGQISQPFTQEQPIAIMLPHNPVVAQGSLLPMILLTIWICGFAVVAVLWWRRWRRVRSSLRSASSLSLVIDIPVLSSPILIEPGVFGLFHPVLVLPEGITNHLSPAQLEAVIAHEMCHVRRRDNLTAAIHMIVEAIFWFHPLVWWLGARLVEERERACDEEVLRLGNEPQIYAESILKTCQFYLESPLTCVSGITGSDLKQRVIRIMTHGLEQKLNFWRKSLLAAAGLAAVLGPILLGLLHTPATQAQSQRISFEVASIKPTQGDPRGMRFGFSPGGRFTGNNISVKFLIQEAYHVKEAQISGKPSWVDSEHYDIEAKIEDSVAQAMQKLSPDQRREQMMQLFQSLLSDRFKLTSHHDKKDLPVLALLVAKDGPKLQETALTPAELAPPSPKGPLIRLMGRGQLSMTAVDLDLFADALSREIRGVVLNQTGLTAKYDFKLQWTPDEGPGPPFSTTGIEPAPPPDSNGPSIFAALQEQLGLKLEAQKQPLDVIVIDHIEKPSVN